VTQIERLDRFRIGRLEVDCLTFPAALSAIEVLVRAGRGGAVFTPNVDHVVTAEDNDAFARAYAAADLTLADGMPLVWLSRWLGPRLPEKVSGSDLVPRLLDLAAARAFRVFLFGGAEGSVERAASRIQDRYPRIQIVGLASPRVEIDEPPEQRAKVVQTIQVTKPDLVLVGLGSPKQELFIHAVARDLAPAVLLGVGASIDFLAGAVPRAPAWVSSHGLEWLYRLTREPKRLAPRYLFRDPKFLWVLARDLFARARGGRVAAEVRP
jgi:N-acetylglucosaminyldiphosphoundecaprenol N-acetyl-beta-D-mannosaminyltransferase